MQRYRIDGTTVEGNVFLAKCYECGMGLLVADEFHPYEACQEFERTHDSGKVAALLSSLKGATDGDST